MALEYVFIDPVRVVVTNLRAFERHVAPSAAIVRVLQGYIEYTGSSQIRLTLVESHRHLVRSPNGDLDCSVFEKSGYDR